MSQPNAIASDGAEIHEDVTHHPDLPCDDCGCEYFANPRNEAVCIDCGKVYV